MCTKASFCWSMFPTGFPPLLTHPSVPATTCIPPQATVPLLCFPLAWSISSNNHTSSYLSPWQLVSPCISKVSPPCVLSRASPHMSLNIFSSYISSPGGCCSFLDVSVLWFDTLLHLCPVLRHDGAPAWISELAVTGWGQFKPLPTQGTTATETLPFVPNTSKNFHLKIIFTLLLEKMTNLDTTWKTGLMDFLPLEDLKWKQNTF